MNIFNILIVVASLAGLYITYRIRKEKQKVKQGGAMVCMVGADCTKVVFSEYSKFFGLDLEKMGFVYYAVTALVYAVGIVAPALITNFVLFISLGLTFGGLLFSIYLTAIQVFRLKNFCTWCLGSALSSTLIFIFAFVKVTQSGSEFLEYLPQVAGIIIVVEMVALVIAACIALYLELSIFKFLKDLVVDAREHAIIKTLFQINWFVLFLFILGNIGVYLTIPVGNIVWSHIYIELGLIAVIIANSLFSTLQTMPGLNAVNVGDSTLQVAKICSLRTIAYVQTAVSLIAWAALLFLNF